MLDCVFYIPVALRCINPIVEKMEAKLSLLCSLHYPEGQRHESHHMSDVEAHGTFVSTIDAIGDK